MLPEQSHGVWGAITLTEEVVGSQPAYFNSRAVGLGWDNYLLSRTASLIQDIRHTWPLSTKCQWHPGHWETPNNSRAVIFNWCLARIFKTCGTWLFSQEHWPLFLQIVKLKKKKKTTTANTATYVQCKCPVLNHKYTCHIVQLHFICHVT